MKFLSEKALLCLGLGLLAPACTESDCSDDLCISDVSELLPEGDLDHLSLWSKAPMQTHPDDDCELLKVQSPISHYRMRLKPGQQCTNDYIKWEPGIINIYLAGGAYLSRDEEQSLSTGISFLTEDIQEVLYLAQTGVFVKFQADDSRFSSLHCDLGPDQISYSSNLRSGDLVFCAASEEWWNSHLENKPKTNGATQQNIFNCNNQIDSALIALRARYLDRIGYQEGVERIGLHEALHALGLAHPEPIIEFTERTGYYFPPEYRPDYAVRSSYESDTIGFDYESDLYPRNYLPADTLVVEKMYEENPPTFCLPE